jgi:hypothetical protein
MAAPVKFGILELGIDLPDVHSRIADFAATPRRCLGKKCAVGRIADHDSARPGFVKIICEAEWVLFGLICLDQTPPFEM